MKKIVLPFLMTFIGIAAFGQDIIFKKNGDEIKAKVIEINTTEVKYKKFSMPAGPTYTILKTDLFMIKYPNGEKDLFNDVPKDSEKKNETVVAKTSTTENTVKTQNTIDQNVQGNTSVQSLNNQTNQQSQESSNNTGEQPAGFIQPQVNIKNTNFTVLHSDLQKISNESKKEEILKLVKALEEALLRDDVKKAWQLQDEIDKLN